MQIRTVPVSVTALTVALLVSATGTAQTYKIDLSPMAAGALNLGSTSYPGDQALGIAAPNAVGQPASLATGDEVGSGISYDAVANILTYDLAYGSAFGFVDLVGSFTVVHFHGPSAVNFPAPNGGAGVLVNLGPDHVASGPQSGRITGSAVLTAAQEQDLLDNEIYINIHSTFAPGGEIRGQLVPVASPPECALLLGTAPGSIRFGDPGDRLLVTNLLTGWEVTIPTVPVLQLPNNPGLAGLELYFQVVMVNPTAFPQDPIQFSNGLKVTIGGLCSRYGAGSGLDLWAPMDPRLGQAFQPAFRIAR